jgi:mannose-6-phosphate isomerase-like protein (cupin superfamily)
MTGKPNRIRHWDLDALTYESQYNAYAGRFFPMEGVDPPDWSGAWVAVAPGETSTRHSHPETEMFFFVRGTGVLRLGDEEHHVSPGDTVYISPGVEHEMTNKGPDRLVFLDVWWIAPDDEKTVNVG